MFTPSNYYYPGDIKIFNHKFTCCVGTCQLKTWQSMVRDQLLFLIDIRKNLDGKSIQFSIKSSIGIEFGCTSSDEYITVCSWTVCPETVCPQWQIVSKLVYPLGKIFGDKLSLGQAVLIPWFMTFEFLTSENSNTEIKNLNLEIQNFNLCTTVFRGQEFKGQKLPYINYAEIA